LSGESGIEPHIIENSKAYIRDWLSAIKEDKNLLFKASSEGRKAKEYIVNNGLSKEQIN